MRRILTKIIFIILIAFFIIWGVSLLKCEILTCCYGHRFDTIYQVNTMLGEIDYLKVLDYNNSYARVYYISKNHTSGNVLSFSRQGDKWIYKAWEQTVWSKAGSADDTIWPYWWHFFYSH